MRWDDLELVLAVADTGSFSGAARQLSVNASTISRRLRALESTLGTPLFEPKDSGLTVTGAGQQIADAARTVKETVLDLERDLSGQDRRLEGPLRITAPTMIFQYFMMPHLKHFAAAYPDIRLELIDSDSIANLVRREADVAVRTTFKPQESLIGWKVADIGYRVYASCHYLGHRPSPDRYITWLDNPLPPEWIAKDFPEAQCSLRTNSAFTLREAAATDFGLAILPCSIGEEDERLLPVDDRAPEVGYQLWVLTHEETKTNARVRAFTRFMRTALAQDQAWLLSGEARPVPNEG